MNESIIPQAEKGIRVGAKKLIKMITKSNIKDVSLTASPESVNFCGAWPAAKKGLEILESIVKNPFLKTAIEMIIKIGDGLCPGN